MLVEIDDDALPRDERRLLHEILELQRLQLVELRRIRHILQPNHRPGAESAKLYIVDSKGNRIMPATLAVGKTATAVLHEFDGPNGTGNELPAVGPVSYSSSDPSIATVDATSGLVTAVAPGTVTITGTDAGNGLSASDTVSDSAPVAQSATLVITAN